jgi:hypothetical protein
MAQDMNKMLDYMVKHLAPQGREIYLSAEYQILKDDFATRSQLIVQCIGLSNIRSLLITCE